jgi:IS30 family transposase
LDRDPALRQQVLAGLQAGWSPEQVAGRLALERGGTVVSHETIYRFVHAQGNRTKDHAWFRLLPRRKTKRGWRGGQGGHPASYIHLRCPLAQRPQEAADRSLPGHWEADLMLFGNRGQSLLVLQERHSRLILGQPMHRKAAAPMAQAMTQLLATLPPQWRQTVTFDNGSEFAQHHRLHDLGIETFFCDTHSPWQKGGVENTNSRLRRYLPRKTDLAQLPEDLPLRVVQTYNNTPRKCLGYRTPAEIYSNQLLHLKCESTFRLSPE